jgi:hypothetical protein
VVLLSAEDDTADTIRPRLDAAGANVSKIIAIQSVRGRDDNGTYDRFFDLERDLAALEAAIRSLPDCKLVVIDPLTAYLGRTKANDNAEVRRVLAPLADMASRLGVAILAISHLRKGEGAAIYRTLGSMAFIAASRAAFVVAKDPNDPTGDRRLMLPMKNNLGGDSTGLAFQLSRRHSHNGQLCVVWEAGPVDTSADDALAPTTPHRGRAPEERAEAIAFLRQALAAGPRLGSDVLADAKGGHGITDRTLTRARRELRVQAYRESPKGKWLWKLPGHAAKSSTSPTLETLWHSGGLDENPRETDEMCPDDDHTATMPERGGVGSDDDQPGDGSTL